MSALAHAGTFALTPVQYAELCERRIRLAAIFIDGVPVPQAPIEYAERFGPTVYFVLDRRGLVKIGLTRNLHQRLGALGREAGKIRLLAWKHGNRNEEIRLHGRFIDLRVEGEWFSASRELIDFILQVRADLAEQYSAIGGFAP